MEARKALWLGAASAIVLMIVFTATRGLSWLTFTLAGLAVLMLVGAYIAPEGDDSDHETAGRAS